MSDTPSSTPPPTMSGTSQIERQVQVVEQLRQDSEQQGTRLADLALDYVLLTLSTPSVLDDRDLTRPLTQFPQPFRRAAATLARLSVAAAIASLFRSTPASPLSAPPPAGLKDDTQRVQVELTEKLLRDSASLARDAAEDTPELLTPRFQEEHELRKTWTTRTGVTTATQANSAAAVELLPAIEEQTGTPMRTMWISRGDTRVRPLHRRLHAQTRAPGEPYWVKLGTGHKLSFPADPDGPLDQTINCRCALILVPADEATAASKMLTMTDEEFALAASSHPSGRHVYDRVDRILHRVFTLRAPL